MKDKIRPIYQELQGYLSQSPVSKTGAKTIYDDSLWNQVNQTIDELNQVSGKNYNKFRIEPKKGMYDEDYVNSTTYGSKLGGLIDRLHAEYFYDEPNPFVAGPSTVISQAQTQEQSTQVVMLLEVQEKIFERLYDSQTGPKEKKFLEMLKDNLAGVKSAIELINLILATAQATGLDLGSLAGIFK
jgi:uncharacterized membrane protein